MKTIILAVVACYFVGHAQQPVIEGDLLLCPDTNGTATITSPIVYDSYQWYFRYWFLADPFVAIDGATQQSFTYDGLPTIRHC